ncbi:MAG: hypothetical protein FJX77_13535 [Armatimonadetes bacterium]|nr:hypothetical protein [Armatimonadota bacterium]
MGEVRQPLLTLTSGKEYLVLATQGQAVPLGTPFFCDHRYYGMQPLWIEPGFVAGQEPAPYRWRAGADRTVLWDPRENPWVPLVRWGGRSYCVRCYDQVRLSRDSDGLTLTAVGVPETYAEAPRWERAIHAGLALLVPYPGPVFRPARLPQARLIRTLRWEAPAGRLVATARLEGGPAGAHLEQAEKEWRPRL